MSATRRPPPSSPPALRLAGGPCLAAALLLGLWGCESREPRDVFAQKVLPVLETGCLSSGCHGVLPDAEASGEEIDRTFFYVDIDPSGRVADEAGAYENVKARINTVELPEFSTLLTHALPPQYGGLPHFGGAVFKGVQDPQYQIVRDWIASESGGGEGKPLSELSDVERQFGEEVLPGLVLRQCLNEACHGPTAPFTAFQPATIVKGAPAFSSKHIAKNREKARQQLFLGGDLNLSRLVRKTLPLEEGGIAHRAGTGAFVSGQDDSLVKAILSWAEAEQALAMGTVPAVEGFVLVGGPLGAATPVDHSVFVPGTDLFVLEPPTPSGTLRNLTSAAHPGGPADIRDPAVNHAGDTVVFSMRKTEADAHNLYVIGVDGTGLRQLTFDAGALPGGGQLANLQPTWGPDGRIYFVSTRAGHLADDLQHLSTDLWSIDPVNLGLDRFTTDPASYLTPTFIGQGKHYGTLASTFVRGIFGTFKGTVLRIPVDRNKDEHPEPEWHPHHGATIPEDMLYAMRAMPDARFVATLLDRDALWRAGTLAIFDRQFGPELPEGADAQASIGDYQRAFTRLDPDGTYRHPVPLPDGRLLVSYVPGLPGLDPMVPPDFRLVLLTLVENPVTRKPEIANRETLHDSPSFAVFDAEPIVRRPFEDDPSHAYHWDPTREKATGRIAVRHLDAVEMLASALAAVGPKVLRDDLVSARVIVPAHVTPAQLAEGPFALGPHYPVYLAAEAPLQGQSLYLEVPADLPFRVQVLDADGLAVGGQPNRWFSVAPGETMPVGTLPAAYTTFCVGCHGAISGAPGDAVTAAPDVVTAASVTLASHENKDFRRPKDPQVLTAEADLYMGVDFLTSIQPLLERSCVSCHGGGAPAGGLDLTSAPVGSFDAAYLALLADNVGGIGGSGGGRLYVDDYNASARKSALMERLLGRELEAPETQTGSCEGNPALSAEERALFGRWIDTGAIYRGVQ